MRRQAASLLLAVCAQWLRRIQSGDASKLHITGLTSRVGSLSTYLLVCASAWRSSALVLRIWHLSRWCSDCLTTVRIGRRIAAVGQVTRVRRIRPKGLGMLLLRSVVAATVIAGRLAPVVGGVSSC